MLAPSGRPPGCFLCFEGARARRNACATQILFLYPRGNQARSSCPQKPGQNIGDVATGTRSFLFKALYPLPETIGEQYITPWNLMVKREKKEDRKKKKKNELSSGCNRVFFFSTAIMFFGRKKPFLKTEIPAPRPLDHPGRFRRGRDSTSYFPV